MEGRESRVTPGPSSRWTLQDLLMGGLLAGREWQSQEATHVLAWLLEEGMPGREPHRPRRGEGPGPLLRLVEEAQERGPG